MVQQIKTNNLPRLTKEDLENIITKKGYGLQSAIKPAFRARTIESEIDRERQEHDMESDSGDESLHSEKLSLNYSGKVRVRITFYRRRLADYSRAISEKALVDCLQYAGLIKGDSEKEIWLEDGGQKKVETDEEERTEIELFYQDVDFDNLWMVAESNKSR